MQPVQTINRTTIFKTSFTGNNAAGAELIAIAFDVQRAHVLDSRLPVTNY